MIEQVRTAEEPDRAFRDFAATEASWRPRLGAGILQRVATRRQLGSDALLAE